jgi:hypothetical protein
LTTVPSISEPDLSPRVQSSIVEISDVAQVASDAVLAQGIDLPYAGYANDEYAIDIAGWVVGRDQTAVCIEVLNGDKLIKSSPVTFVRPMVAERYPDYPAPSGYMLRLGVVGLPDHFELTIQAAMEDGSTVGLARLFGRQESLCRPSLHELQPLMVTSLGRMGTTWMMRLLSEHPAIVAWREYPYEVMAARYWAHQLRVLAAPADYATSSEPGSFGNDLWHVGHNPFYGPLLRSSGALTHWLGRDHVQRMAAFCKETTDGFYRQVAESQGQTGARYFAEKSLPDHIPAVLRGMYPHMRELVLVRDLRDVVCSMLAFNDKRGYPSFGREKALSDAEFVRLLAADMTTLADSWERRRDQGLLIRYEDLICTPEVALTAVFSYLDVDDDIVTVQEVIERASAVSDELAAHRTSPDPQASIGRWRVDLPPELIDECNRAFAGVMARFGYQGVGE